MTINSVKIGNILTKTLGVGALTLVAYDSHMAGKEDSLSHSKNVKTEALTERFLDDAKLESPSIVRLKAKEGLFHYYLNENFSTFFSAISGYAKGFSEMLVNNAIPFGLAVGTVLGKGGPRQLVSKFCGAGLLAYGAIFLAQEAFGIGKSE